VTVSWRTSMWLAFEHDVYNMCNSAVVFYTVLDTNRYVMYRYAG